MKTTHLILSMSLGLGLAEAFKSQAQGLPYWSNLDSSVAGEPIPVGSDDWIANRFNMGASQNGFYRLDSIQVRLTPDSDPDRLRVAIYRWDKSTFFPGAALGALAGPLRAGQPLMEGACPWSVGRGPGAFRAGDWVVRSMAQSTDGLAWEAFAETAQFALTVTPIPEPSSLTLFGLGGWFLLSARHRGVKER